MPYLTAFEVCSRQGATQIHMYLTVPYLVVVVAVATVPAAVEASQVVAI